MRIATPYRFVPIILTVLVVACASGGASSTSSPRTSDRSLISQEDLAAAGTESAYDIIQRLRPEYLRVKPSQQGYFNSGVGDAPPPAVVSRGQRVGELADLRRIPAVSLSEIRYYNIEQAKLKYGMQYTGGVIELTYKQQ